MAVSEDTNAARRMADPEFEDVHKLLFHGTTRACLLGEDDDRLVPCDQSKCYLCSIIKDGYDVEKCGKGLYLAQALSLHFTDDRHTL